MKVIPQQNYLLIRLHDMPSESDIQLPEGLRREPYGVVALVGPDCTFIKPGDKILFMKSALLIGYDKGFDERYLISEGSVIAKCDPESTQDGMLEPENGKNSPEMF